ncbi:MAG TPA: cupin domain-containing protein [Anaerolineales bacterium]
MKIYRFDEDVGRSIMAHGSQNVVWSGVVKVEAGASVSCIHIGTGGILGYHPAAEQQLFMVVDGEGWVSGENKRPVRIAAGQAAYWEKGEKHEAGSDSGMLVIVIEAEQLDPQAYMPMAQEWLE